MWQNFRKNALNINHRTVDQQHSTEAGNCRMFKGRRKMGSTLFWKPVSMFKRSKSEKRNGVASMVDDLENGNFETVQKIIEKYVVNGNERKTFFQAY